MEIIDKITQAEIVNNLLKKLQALYVFPDIAEQVSNHLQKHLEDGDYDEITEGEFFAYALTMHMQEICNDEHLWVRWHPKPLPEQEGPLRHNQTWMDMQCLEAQLDNFGIHKLERLPGNVGYIDIRKFYKVQWAGDTAVAAMNYLANTTALIIDLRNCQGGYPDMVSLICSYLLREEPVHLGSIYWREEDQIQQYWTLPYVPGKRYGSKLVYILISKVTFSAGEAFAHYLKNQQRVTLIGENTDGALILVLHFACTRTLRFLFPLDMPSIPLPARPGRTRGWPQTSPSHKSKLYMLRIRWRLNRYLKASPNPPLDPIAG